MVPPGEKAWLCKLHPDESDRLITGRKLAAVIPCPPVPGPVAEPVTGRVPGGEEIRTVFDERAVPDAVSERAEEDGAARGYRGGSLGVQASDIHWG